MAKTLFYSLKPEGVVINMVDAATGMPKFETLQASHPYFKRVVRALKRKEWARVPRLISIAQTIADKSYGNVEVRKDGLYYKGRSIDNSLTTRILQMIKEGKTVSNMLRFMDSLFQNPEEFAIHELYDWLNGCKLPITDRGTFMAYKRVTKEYKDCRTQSIDNSVGQIVFMKREDVCKDRTQTCEQGLHFCSIAYLPSYPGERVMMVEINPKDVVSIPDDYDYSKGRTWMYEVVQEVPEDQVSTMLDQGTDIEDYRCAVYSVAKDRKKLLADILALPTVRSMIRYQKKVAGRKRVKRGRKAKTEQFLLSEKSIRKMTIGRLRKLYIQFAPPEPPKVTVSTENRLEAIRKTYGFTRGQVAEAMGVSYSAVFNYERAKELAQETIDSYLGAIMKLAKLGNSASTGISFPKPTVKFTYTAPASPAPEAEEEGDEFGYEEYNDGWGEEEEEEEEAFN